MGIEVVCAGTYCKNDSEWFREQTQAFCDEILITDDHAQVREMITRINPAAIFGTQMERHIGKQLGIPCGVISAPVHIQNFSLGYRPFLGYEGTNNISDLIYNTFTLGMEDHLLEIFGGHDVNSLVGEEPTHATEDSNVQKQYPSFTSSMEWDSEALELLHKIPRAFIGPAQKLTEHFAQKQNIQLITIDVMNSAKESGGF
jgi:light-independent protochlorophyllide reductase subunit B